ncbi:MAG TPA: long-chain fatty acid--CoA ligase [Spirochaetota bacterium]|nr:long-chain fatty acid--CoA ligase [Spirochaetota bacterium]
MSTDVTYKDRPWIKHYAPGVPANLQYKEICIPQMLKDTVQIYPDKTALVCQDFHVAYKELDVMVDRFAAVLSGFGIKKGDKVAVLLPNCIQIVVAYYAILSLGAVAVMNNPLYSDRELEHQFNDSGSKLLIVLDVLCERMIALREKTGIKQIIYTSMSDYLPEGVSGTEPLDFSGRENLYRWLDCFRGDAGAGPVVDLSFDDTAILQYTGGTTGVSKAAVLTHRNLSSMIQMYEAWFVDGKRGDETVLAASPFFHILGMQVSMNLSIYMGWKDVLLPVPQPFYILEAIRKYNPNFSPLVPTHYIGMLQHPDLEKTDLTSFRGLFSGGASLPVDILHKFEEVSKAEICEGFGMSETSPQTHLNPYCGGGPRKPGSIGVPWIDTEVRVVDLTDGETDMPVGEPGEMLFRGPQVTKGYWNRPDETEMAITKDGWLHSGDIAYMDSDGYFFVVDRKKDMIISSGYNIYPREVEEIFYQNPKVSKVAVIGLPDDKRGENVGVFLTLKEGQAITSDELMEFCKPKLAKYKWPSLIEIRDSLPESNVGKLLKKELRAEVLGNMKK